MRKIKSHKLALLFHKPNIISCALYTMSMVVWVINIANNFSLNPILNSIAALLALMLSIYSLILAMGNWYIFIICGCVAYFNYSICIYYYLSDMNTEFYSSFINDNVMTIGINIILIFILILCICLERIRIPKTSFSFFNREQKQTWIFLILFVMLVFIWFYGYSKPLPGEERGHLTALYEYSIILIILLYFYAGIDKRLIILATALVCLFIVKDLHYGGRSTSIQLIVCAFLILFSHKISIKTLLPYAILGFFALSFVGELRADTEWTISALMQIISKKLRTAFVLDTSVSAYFTALTFVKVKSLYSVLDIAHYLGCFLLSILGGGRVIGSELPLITYKYYPHSYGGILPFYFYFIGGWLGCILSSCFINVYLKTILKQFNVNSFFKCCSVYWACTVFRWYMYTPLALIRGTLIFAIAYLGIWSIRNLVRSLKGLSRKGFYVKHINEI